MIRSVRCKTCAYWQPQVQSVYGQCRRYPPTPHRLESEDEADKGEFVQQDAWPLLTAPRSLLLRLRLGLLLRASFGDHRFLLRCFLRHVASLCSVIPYRAGGMHLEVGSVIVGDALEALRLLPDQCAHTCVTSPPYWGLRDYGVEGQFGHEKTPEEYVAKMVEVFREVRRVLRDDGTLWLNLGDSYAGSWGAQGRQGKTGELAGRSACAQRQIAASAKKQSGTGSVAHLNGIKSKDLVGIPWLVAFALRADGWYLRSDIVWHKPNPMPESVTDRPTKAHEYIFLLAKSEKYFYDKKAVLEPTVSKTPAGNKATFYKGRNVPGTRGGGWQDRPRPENSIPKDGRNRRSVWTVTTKPFKGAHFATFPPDLIEPCVLAGSPPGGTVLDPFFGAGTTGVVAAKHGRRYIGIELNPEYAAMAQERIARSRVPA